jgi:hypothetical protein
VETAELSVILCEIARQLHNQSEFLITRIMFLWTRPPGFDDATKTEMEVFGMIAN